MLGAADAGVEGCVEEVGCEVYELVEKGAEDDDGTDDGHVGRMNCIDGDGAESGDAEEAFEEE